MVYELLTDLEDPQIACVESFAKQTDGGLPTTVVQWEKPTATDNSGNFDVICNPPSGTSFIIGKTMVGCEAVDESGNRAVCDFHVDIIGKNLEFPKLQ